MDRAADSRSLGGYSTSRHREERRRCGRQPPAAPPRAGACEVGYERVRSLKHSAAAGSTGRFEVTELTQPLAAAPTETIAARPPQVVESHSTSFSELIYARFEWWREQRRDDVRSSIKTAYDAAVAAFERQQGEIVSAYLCAHVESAVVLTRKKPSFPWSPPVFSFFRESDWSTHNSPEIACELHRCDELAVRAETVLTGVRQRICMQLVMASASHLLGLVDARAAHASAAVTSAALQQERAALTKAEAYYREAANGQAQMVYFSGMAVIAIAISIVAAVWLTIS